MNKTMKFFAVSAMFFSAFFMTVNAQNYGPKNPQYKKEFSQKSPEERANIFVNRLNEKITLSEQQKKEIYTIKLNEIKAHQVLMQQQKDLKLKAKGDLEKILTPEQKTKLQELKANRTENFKGKPYPNRPAPYHQGQKGNSPTSPDK
ncbi:MAG: hypothetical protein LC105_07890 [Chitinophagales bacterium]|nr:hypothetical protein [Chitinophagales bacterium]MCZ2393759.1 hypothetical protein [Chitinophagales bacterium]